MEKLKKCEEVATIWEARKIMTGRKILHSSVSQFIQDFHTCEKLGHDCVFGSPL